MAALVSDDLTLNQVLKRLGYTVVRHREASNGARGRSVRKGGKAVRFPTGTLTGDHQWVDSLEHTTAGIVWRYLHNKGEIKCNTSH